MGLTHIGLPNKPRCESFTGDACVPEEDWKDANCVACLYVVMRESSSVDEVNAIGDYLEAIQRGRDRAHEEGSN